MKYAIGKLLMNIKLIEDVGDDELDFENAIEFKQHQLVYILAKAQNDEYLGGEVYVICDIETCDSTTISSALVDIVEDGEIMKLN